MRWKISDHVNGVRVEDLACADLGARHPISVRGNLLDFFIPSRTPIIIIFPEKPRTAWRPKQLVHGSERPHGGPGPQLMFPQIAQTGPEQPLKGPVRV